MLFSGSSLTRKVALKMQFQYANFENFTVMNANANCSLAFLTALLCTYTPEIRNFKG